MAEAVSYRVLELSPSAFAEIQEKLLDAGYDWLVFPHNGSIPMDGFILQSSDPPVLNAVGPTKESASCATSRSKL